MTFSITAANEERKRRIKAICDHYGVAPFWGQDMWLPEIEHFEAKIKAGDAPYPSRKIKARDIIAGWPRGRSTLPTYHNDRWRCGMRWPMLALTGFMGVTSLKAYEARLIAEDDQAERDYHEAQQRMVDDWQNAHPRYVR